MAGLGQFDLLEKTMNEHETQIVTAARSALRESAGELSADALVAAVEQRLGRKLKPYEAGLYLHRARQQFLRDTKQEIVSKGGKLSIASPRQSLNRRRSKNERAVKALRSNAEEMEILLSRDDLTGEIRTSLGRLRDKTADMALDLQTAQRRRLRGIVQHADHAKDRG